MFFDSSEYQRLRGEGVYKVPVVRDEEDPTGEVLQRAEERVLGLDIEVVGRLVEDEQL